MGRGGGQVVSVLAHYSKDLSLNPAEAYSFNCKIVFEKNENKQKDFYMSLCFNRVSSLGLQPNRWAIDTSQRLNKNLDIWAWSRTVNTEQAKHLLLPLILNSYHFRRIFSFHVGDAKNIYFCIFIARGRASNKGETR